jgi:hypothetical protein
VPLFGPRWLLRFDGWNEIDFRRRGRRLRRTSSRAMSANDKASESPRIDWPRPNRAVPPGHSTLEKGERFCTALQSIVCYAYVVMACSSRS